MAKYNNILKKFSIRFIITIILFSTVLPVSAQMLKESYIEQSNINSIKKNIKIARFIEVDKDFYRGGQPSDEDLKYLSMIGVKTIINFRLPEPDRDAHQKKLAQKYGMNYNQIGINPFIPPTDAQVKYFFEILDNPKNLPVFVHCWHGEDRTGVMTGLYRIKEYKWSANKAYHEMLSNGFHQRLFYYQKRFVFAYAQKINHSQH